MSSSPALLDPPVVEEDPWVELDEPATPFASQEAMRFGARTYTAFQGRFIDQVVRDRTQLSEPPIQIDD